LPPKIEPHVKLEWWIEGRQGEEQEAVYAGVESPPWRLSISALYPYLNKKNNYSI
jgi:hypothetical protein